MKFEKYTEYLCCTYCKNELALSSNVLKCTSCNKEYAIKEDIPVMVDLANLPPHLRGQIEYFENEDVTEHGEYRLDEWQKSYVERFFDNFPSISNKVVIDEGTGSGYMAVELAQKGTFIIALDLTLKSLIRLKKIAESLGLEDRFIFICCTAEQLPIKPGVADYFISNAVLEHLPMEASAIEEINRTCKKDAGAMITVPLKFRYLNPLLIPVNLLHDHRIGHLRRYDEDTIQKKFPSWRVKKSYYTGHFNKVVKTIVNMIRPVFKYEDIEAEDRKFESVPSGASNIITFLERGSL